MPSPASIEINRGIKERFFKAIVALIESKKLRGRQTYCRLYDIDKRNFYSQEKDLQEAKLKLYWLVPLVTEYGISAHWLLTGAGQMFESIAQRKQRATMYDKETGLPTGER
ncbi:MAG: hypothetical protein NC548_42495 [Lachnospiraceae bacterium]|nr:hypothetical protein [Lachnospiraceae bacterium]